MRWVDIPLYKYKCDNCKHTFTKLLDKPLDKALCPNCGKQAKRTLSSFSTRYKGKGFYSTDYKGDDDEWW